MPHITIEFTKREKEDLNRATRRAGVAQASIARDLLFAYFKITASKRRVSGPRAKSTAAARARMEAAS